MASPSFGLGLVHGRRGEESWGLREALRAQAQFGAFLHMTHDQHNSKACESTKADSSPGGTPKGPRDELRKQPGWLDMPHPRVSPGQKLLGALQNSVQHPPELLWLSRDPQPWNHLHEPSPPPLSASSQATQRKAIPASLCFFFSLCLLFPLSSTHRFHTLPSAAPTSAHHPPLTLVFWVPGPRWNMEPCHGVTRVPTPLWWTRIKGIIKINLLNSRYFPLCAVPRELEELAAGNTKMSWIVYKTKEIH